VLIVGGVTAAVVLSSGDSGSGAATAKRSVVKVGEVAPDFELTTLDGKKVKLSDYAGTPVVLNFWASWCTPCREEFPALRSAYAQAHGKWALVGVNSQDFVESDGRKFAKDQKATWPNGFDNDSVVSGAYGVQQLPQTFFIDAKGVIRDHLFGGLTADSLQEELQKLGAA
jgi:peroxiredoxin